MKQRVPESAAGERLDRYLASLPDVGSRGVAERLLAAGEVRVDGLELAKSYRLAGGEQVEFDPPEPSADTHEPEPKDHRIANEDDAIDQLYDQVYRELLTFMMADPSTINRATHLLWVCHNLERIADRVTNICERVVFLTTGKMEEFNVSKY